MAWMRIHLSWPSIWHWLDAYSNGSPQIAARNSIRRSAHNSHLALKTNNITRIIPQCFELDVGDGGRYSNNIIGIINLSSR